MQDLVQCENILIIAKNGENCQKLGTYLEQYSYRISYLPNSTDAFYFLLENKCDFIIAGYSVIAEEDLEFCKNLRSRMNIPLIALSDSQELSDKVMLLELGADDYITTPCENREVLARIRTIIRRLSYSSHAQTQVPKYYHFDGWKLDCQERLLVDMRGETINLSGAEYKLLLYFLSKPQKVISREKLLEVIQGTGIFYERNPTDRSIDVQISRLRAKIKDNPKFTKYIKTVRGDGYVFATPVTVMCK